MIPASRISPLGLAFASISRRPTRRPRYYGANDLTASASFPAGPRSSPANWTKTSPRGGAPASAICGIFHSNPATRGSRLRRAPISGACSGASTLRRSTICSRLIRPPCHGPVWFQPLSQLHVRISQGYNLASRASVRRLSARYLPRCRSFPYVSDSNLMPLGASDNNSFFVQASRQLSAPTWRSTWDATA